MSKDSAISWTHHTFNPWWGCVKISAGCAHCYADAFAHRLGLKIWGQDADRRFFGDKHWNEPLAWEKSAALRGVRDRVFCASMADVFEDRRDLDIHRARLWALIESTPHLDWLLLTKRPDVAVRLWPWTVPGFPTPPNVLIGTTVEDQRAADERIPHLLKINAVRFLSVEPLISAVDLERVAGVGDVLCGVARVDQPLIDWVIVGGESGPGRRSIAVDLITDVVRQCVEAGVAVHVKQDVGARAGMQGRIPDAVWALKQFPEVRT